MATMAIFSILTVLLSGMYIQSYKISASTEKDNEAQDEYRKTLMVMETDIKDKVANGYKVYVYKEERRCGIINGEETPDGTGDNIFKGCDVAQPLISIIKNVTGSDHRIMYALVEQSKGSSVYNLEQIEFRNTNNSSEENEASLEKFTVNPVQGTRKVLIKDITSGLLSKDINNENLISMNFKINTLNSGQREYETAINLERNSEYEINITTSPGGSGANGDLSEIFSKPVTGIFKNTDSFNISNNYSWSGNVMFETSNKGHSGNCSHNPRDNKIIVYKEVKGASFLCEHNRYNVDSTKFSLDINKLEFKNDNYKNEKSVIFEKKEGNSLDDFNVKVSISSLENKNEFRYIRNYEYNGNKFDIIISNADINIVNMSRQSVSKNLSENTLIVVTSGTISITRDNINEPNNKNWGVENIALVAKNIVCDLGGDFNSSSILMIGNNLNLTVSYLNINKPLANYTSTVTIIDNILKGGFKTY